MRLISQPRRFDLSTPTMNGPPKWHITTQNAQINRIELKPLMVLSGPARRSFICSPNDYDDSSPLEEIHPEAREASSPGHSRRSRSPVLERPVYTGLLTARKVVEC